MTTTGSTGTTGRRRLPGKKTLGIVAVVLAVLAAAGYSAKPLWQPWYYAATLCGGSLSGGDLAELLPRERLAAGKDTFGSGGDPLKCAVNESDGEHYVLRAEAQTGGTGAGGPLAVEFTIPGDPRYAYSAEVPGFYGRFGPMLIQECPKLGRDTFGRKQRLITNVYSHGVERDPSPESLRMGVRIANAANDELGCGAEKLPEPDRVEPVRKLSVAQARDTMCGWVTRAKLPRSPSGKAWQVVAPTDVRAPITSCALVDSGTGENAVNFTGWYGDWTIEPFETLMGANVKLPEGYDTGDALVTKNFGRAAAVCDGEAANFYANSYESDTDRPALPMSQVRGLLNAFAEDQAGQRDCEGLKLPGRTVYPRSR